MNRPENQLCFWTGGLEEPVIISWDGSSPCQAHHVPKWTGPVLWYSTCLQVQNPKPNDRMSVGHSRSKGGWESGKEREFCSIEVVLGCCMILSTVSLVTLWNNFFSMASVATREDGEVGAAVENDAGEEVLYNAQGKKKGKHDKPKPWDTPDIDHWKLERFDPSWNEGGMLEESSFSTLFPQYRGSLSLSLSLSRVRGCRVVEIGRIGSSMPSGSCLFSSRIAMHWPLFSLRLRVSFALS